MNPSHTLINFITTLLTAGGQFTVRFLAMASSNLTNLPRKTQISLILFAAIFVIGAIQDPGFIFLPARQLRVGIFAMMCCTFTSYLILATKQKLESSKSIQDWLDDPPRKHYPAEYEKEDGGKCDWLTVPIVDDLWEHPSGIIGPSPQISRKYYTCKRRERKALVDRDGQALVDANRERNERRWHWDRRTHTVVRD